MIADLLGCGHDRSCASAPGVLNREMKRCRAICHFVDLAAPAMPATRGTASTTASARPGAVAILRSLSRAFGSAPAAMQELDGVFLRVGFPSIRVGRMVQRFGAATILRAAVGTASH